ncbi:polysaccharide deacetylase family protein [Mariniflexile ostreae]|uniref:Polysaccharide deacetylase family protein n=1 Tax=Mariniflexile ostreae TaxID=1520892 RepID=A0ABV5F906_9FLAO
MSLIPTKTPLAVKKLFPNYTWNLSTAKKTIYLTFDDGPTPEITNWTLSVLKQYHAKATFFCIGDNAEKHPEVFKTILKDGHTIGNHTHNHLNGWKTKTKEYLRSIEKTHAVLQSYFSKHETGVRLNDQEWHNPLLFRPPYGRIKPKQGRRLRALGYKIIMWDILSFDWDASVSPETCAKRVINKTSNGSIIVFHDSKKASKNMMYALPKVLDYFSKRGYSFESIK